MKLDAKCSCGAEFHGHDERGRFIHMGGKPDEQGRIYVMQRDFDNWLDKHNNCARDSRLSALTGDKP